MVLYVKFAGVFISPRVGDSLGFPVYSNGIETFLINGCSPHVNIIRHLINYIMELLIPTLYPNETVFNLSNLFLMAKWYLIRDNRVEIPQLSCDSD